MAKCQKLIEKARRSAANLRFEEALALAECLGFEYARTSGSHRIYKRAGLEQTVNLQPDKREASKAKKRQVEQMLKIYDELGLLEER